MGLLGRGGSLARPFLLPLAVLGIWLACALPSLERSRLQDVDELLYARWAQAAALQGRWWPLQMQGRALSEKPPLLIWMAGATARAAGRPYDAWPYRVWTCLAAGMALAALAALGLAVGEPGSGLLAALALALQGDFVFHARFFTMDAPFLACALAALAFSARAAGGGRQRHWWLAGACLALAVWFKSWFVLALAPAWGWALFAALPRERRGRAALALALPPFAALGLWLALYVDWNGWSFLAEEWGFNLAGRALGRANQADPEGHALFYLKWAAQSAPALLPWALATPLVLAPQAGASAPAGGERGLSFSRHWTWALCLSWLLGMALVRAETINYPLPLEAGLCRGLGLELSRLRRDPGAWLCAWLCAGLLALGLAAAWGLWDPAWPLALGALLALLALAARARGLGEPLRSPRIPGIGGGTAGRWACAILGLLLVLRLGGQAWGLLARPLDGNRQLAGLLQAHPARRDGETLLVLGPPTQAVDFYGAYAVQRLAALPAGRPAAATLVDTRQGWIFYPPWDAPAGRGPGPQTRETP